MTGHLLWIKAHITIKLEAAGKKKSYDYHCWYISNYGIICTYDVFEIKWIIWHDTSYVWFNLLIYINYIESHIVICDHPNLLQTANKACMMMMINDGSGFYIVTETLGLRYFLS